MKNIMKTNRALIIVIVAIVIGGGIMAFSGDNSQDTKVVDVASASTLSTDRQIHDFGEIDIFSGVVTTTFVLTNEGTEDIIVSEGTTSCGCTNAELEGVGFGMHEKMNKDVIVPAGEKRDLTVIYNPLAHGPNGTGLAQRSVFLKTNSSVTPELEVRIKAMVTKSAE